jgi:hypothetical protein
MYNRLSYICQDIFGRIDIMYCRLSYVFRGVLPLKTLVLYIYRSRGTMQYKQQASNLYAIYYSDRSHGARDYRAPFLSIDWTACSSCRGAL